MTIRAALDRLVVIQEAVKITDPATVQTKKAYKYVPPRKTLFSASDLPVWFNNWTLPGQIRPGVAMAREEYVIHSQCLAGEVDLEYASDLASALFIRFKDDLYADVNLGGNVTQAVLRGGNPTLATLEWGGKAYIGLDLFIDIQIIGAQAFGSSA